MIARVKNIDVAKNLRVIEWLKAELVESVAALFKSLLRAGDDAVSDALANIIISTYLLGRRVGISFAHLDMKVKGKLRLSIDETHEVERWYGDLSRLMEYLDKGKELPD